jgi:hypothetical protein
MTQLMFPNTGQQREKANSILYIPNFMRIKYLPVY